MSGQGANNQAAVDVYEIGYYDSTGSTWKTIGSLGGLVVAMISAFIINLINPLSLRSSYGGKSVQMQKQPNQYLVAVISVIIGLLYQFVLFLFTKNITDLKFMIPVVVFGAVYILVILSNFKSFYTDTSEGQPGYKVTVPYAFVVALLLHFYIMFFFSFKTPPDVIQNRSERGTKRMQQMEFARRNKERLVEAQYNLF
jgi:hypothetical protein